MGEEDIKNQQSEPQAQPQPPAQPKTDPEKEKLEKELEGTKRDLTEAKAQLEAYKAGVIISAVEDATYLAVRECEKSGNEVTTESIAEALKGVLKRHPEWQENNTGTPANVKFGAGTAENNNTEQETKQRATGAVII